MVRRAAKVDRNQPEIVAAFRSFGASVQHLHMVGQGCPDILIGYRGHNVLVEIKDHQQPASKRKLTPDERDFFVSWKGKAVIVETVKDVQEIMALIAMWGS